MTHRRKKISLLKPGRRFKMVVAENCGGLMHNGARGMERKTTEFISETEIHVNWPTKECMYFVTVYSHSRETEKQAILLAI